MKRCLLFLFMCPLLLLQSLIGQTKGELLERFDSQRASKHFVYQWNTGQTNAGEIDEAETLAEEVYSQLSRALGAEQMPDKKLIITFGGEGVNKDNGRKRTPYVDNQGRTHLYRFEMGGYLTPLAHELVHAVRVGKVPFWQGFFEEGLASGLAYHLYPERRGFPRFGHNLDLVAGYWLTSGKGIPIRTMLRNHSRLNLKCQLQTYVIREDFFNYLITEFGLEKMVQLAYANEVGTDEGYQKYFGHALDQLVQLWEVNLRERFNAIDQPESLVDDYFNNTSARYIPQCEVGTDY